MEVILLRKTHLHQERCTSLFAKMRTSLFANCSAFLFAKKRTLLFAVYSGYYFILALAKTVTPGEGPGGSRGGLHRH